ncbi:MAG: hypothetical protein IVW57_06825 [Ktedonobacterales bacterium]|nr:hypothetical protein [Ktedonobacterales bacterium]
MAERIAWHGTPVGNASALSTQGAAGTAFPDFTPRATPAGGVPRVAPRPSGSGVDAALLSPAGPRFWTRQGGGHQVLAGIALAHVIIGMGGIALGFGVWYVLGLGALPPVIASGAALLAALAGAIAFELARFSHPVAALIARVVLVSFDLIVCASLLWLFGVGSIMPMLFLVPCVVAALFFAPRRAALWAALAVALFVGVAAARAGFATEGVSSTPLAFDVWAPPAAALAGLAALLISCCGRVFPSVTEGFALAFRRIDALAGQRAALRSEQQRLVETLRLLEDAQARLGQERALINRQILEVARAAERLSEGDTGAVRALRPGMYGPVSTLGGTLARLGQRLAMIQGQQHHQTTAQQRALESLTAAAREQSQLLALTDNSLRELGTAANDLVAQVQRLERGSGEMAGVDRRVLFQALREIEQHMLTQASDTAMLGARLAQLRARQVEIETSARHIARVAPAEPAAEPHETGDGTPSPAAPVAPGEYAAPAFAGVGMGQRLESAGWGPDRTAAWLT